MDLLQNLEFIKCDSPVGELEPCIILEVTEMVNLFNICLN
jgi:hypothetical protein